MDIPDLYDSEDEDYNPADDYIVSYGKNQEESLLNRYIPTDSGDFDSEFED